MRVLATLPLVGVLAACATAPPQPVATPVPGPPPSRDDSAAADLEPIYAASMGRGGLTVRVNSNGCTGKADFTTQVLDGWPAATFILKRVKPDLCRAFVAGGTELTFSYGELGVAPNAALVLANPLTSDPTPGR